MLERFHVSDDEAIRINHKKMHNVVSQIFMKVTLGSLLMCLSMQI